MPTGFVERIKGKVLSSADSVTQTGKGGALFKGGGTIYANTSTAGLGNTSDTNSDTLDSFSLPANSLQNNNYLLNIFAFGKLGANANAKTITLSFGSASAVFTDSVSLSGGQPWSMQVTIMKAASNVQVISGLAVVNATYKGATYSAGGVTDTAAIAVSMAGRTSVATANDIVLNGWFIEAYNF